MANIQTQTKFYEYTSGPQDQARRIENARSNNYQIELLTRSHPDLTQDQACNISAAVKTLRCSRDNDTVVGRKIGFTNKSIWPEYNVDRSNWSYMYRSSVIDTANQDNANQDPSICNLAEFSNLEPKIEPELVLGLKDAIRSDMSDEQVLNCIAWIAHGFEIVISIYPGWNFTAADTTAAFALHGKLLLGAKTYLPSNANASLEASAMLKSLETFKINLIRNDSLADEGVGSNVLGSPVNALRHLAELLEKDEVNLPLGAGEIITTGTLTRALGIGDGDRWRTEIDGLDVAPLDVRFEMKR